MPAVWGGMPVPVSPTVRTAAVPSTDGATVNVTDPSKVNLKAFESRLRTIFSHMSRSTWTSAGRGTVRTLNSSPARSIAERKLEAISAVSAARSTGL